MQDPQGSNEKMDGNKSDRKSPVCLQQNGIFVRLRRKARFNLILTTSFVVATLCAICNIFLLVGCHEKKFLSGFLIALLLCKLLENN